jgi:hypothetical protein
VEAVGVVVTLDEMGSGASQQAAPHARDETQGGVTATTRPETTGRSRQKDETDKNSRAAGNVEVSVFILYPEIIEWKEHLYMLKFNDGEIGKLYRLYKKLLVYESEELSIPKLLSYCSVADSPFMIKYVEWLKNPSGNIGNFLHFTLTLWHYCTIGKDIGPSLPFPIRPHLMR